ncbi:hypothetical protein Tco_0133024 [Tanacetum coccineum]
MSGNLIELRDIYLIALNDKEVEPEKYKIFKNQTVENSKLKSRLKETLGLLPQKEHNIQEGLKLKAYEISVVKEKHDKLVKHSLLTKSSFEGLLKEKNMVIKDLKVKVGNDLDKLIAVMDAPVISISSDTSEESVGSHAPRVILFGAIHVIIPEVPVVPADAIVTPEVGTVSVVSPFGVLDLVDYSPSFDSDPSEDSLPPALDLPLVSPFLCSDDLEVDGESEPAE